MKSATFTLVTTCGAQNVFDCKRCVSLSDPLLCCCVDVAPNGFSPAASLTSGPLISLVLWTHSVGCQGWCTQTLLTHYTTHKQTAWADKRQWIDSWHLRIKHSRQCKKEERKKNLHLTHKHHINAASPTVELILFNFSPSSLLYVFSVLVTIHTIHTVTQASCRND